MRNRWIFVLPVLVGMTSCRDDGVMPRIESPTAPEVRTGYIVGRYGEPLHVSFQVVGGRGIFEGDIDLGPADEVPATLQALQAPAHGQPGRAGPRLGSTISGSNYRWPRDSDGRAAVPYTFNAAFPTAQRATVLDAMDHITSRVPSIKFVPANATHTVYLVVGSVSAGCVAGVGRPASGTTFMSLAPDCSRGNTIHELAHVLGMWHEQSRCDRDRYVQILWDNIKQSSRGNFQRHCSTGTTFTATHPDDVTHPDGTDYGYYDEGSIMHYGRYAESQNGQPTIVSKFGMEALMGQRNGLSTMDVSTLAFMYPSMSWDCCVTISGPDAVYRGTTYTWTANVAGGDGSYSYVWEYQTHGATTWSMVDTGNAWTAYIALPANTTFHIRLTVTSGSNTLSHTKSIFVQPT
jgi:Astacin (Peptidase family M12A)